MGQKEYQAQIIENEDPAVASVYISTSAFKKNQESTKRHHESISLNYRLLAGTILKLGPLVGVLLARKTDSEYPLPAGRESQIYAEMTLTAAKKNIFLYFFYTDGVDWQRKIISGHRYVQTTQNKTGWLRADFPLPDIIYNRIAYRSKERENKVQAFMQKAQDESIYLFNTRFLDKWEVHKSLFFHSITRHLVPDTYAFRKENLACCIANYPEFFIKPAGSSVGKGIIKVKVDTPQLIRYYRVGNKIGWQQCHSGMELFNQLGISEGEKHILQQGIDLASISDDQVFDVRCQVQKNGRGVWQLTGKAIRIAAPGKFVTHVPNGGRRAAYESTIKDVFGADVETRRKLNQQLNTIAQLVPRVLEESLGLNLAVLSIDIGIDKEARMWIIEVNSKPASFDEDEIRARHLVLLNDYLLYKTDFSVQ